MAKFKVGDRVRCTKEDGLWNHDGLGTIKVVDETDDIPYLVFLDDLGDTWWYREASVSSLRETTTLEWHTPDESPDRDCNVLVYLDGGWSVFTFSEGGFYDVDGWVWESEELVRWVKWTYLPE